jgi:hypothetical protein
MHERLLEFSSPKSKVLLSINQRCSLQFHPSEEEQGTVQFGQVFSSMGNVGDVCSKPLEPALAKGVS